MSMDKATFEALCALKHHANPDQFEAIRIIDEHLRKPAEVPPGMVLVQIADANRLCDFAMRPKGPRSFGADMAALRVRALIDKAVQP